MKKIVLFQTPNPMKIKMAVATMRLRVESVDSNCYYQKIDDIVNGSLNEVVPPSVTKPEGSLLLMCDLSDSEVNAVLSRLRAQKLSFTYKCILTPTNQNWNVYELYEEMEKERQMYAEMERM